MEVTPSGDCQVLVQNSLLRSVPPSRAQEVGVPSTLSHWLKPVPCGLTSLALLACHRGLRNGLQQAGKSLWHRNIGAGVWKLSRSLAEVAGDGGGCDGYRHTSAPAGSALRHVCRALCEASILPRPLVCATEPPLRVTLREVTSEGAPGPGMS